MSDSDQTWNQPGRSKPVVPLLLSRLMEHSPELVAQVRLHLKNNGETLTQRVTYDGTDASARVSLLFVEALLSFEQLRVELLEQTNPCNYENQVLPAHMTLAMSEAYRLEPVLLHAAKSAFLLHSYVWNAHEGAIRPPPKPSSDGEEPEKPSRGRWGSRDPSENS